MLVTGDLQKITIFKEPDKHSKSIPSVFNHSQVLVGSAVSNLRGRVHLPRSASVTPFRNIRPAHSDDLYYTIDSSLHGKTLHLHPLSGESWQVQLLLTFCNSTRYRTKITQTVFAT